LPEIPNMSRTTHERILLIGDAKRDVQAAVAQAAPGAQVTSVATVFDGIAELAANPYTTVMAAVEPIERRPEAAVRALRELARDGRLILFGRPTWETLSRKMMQFGCDDYIVTPASAGELEQVFGAPRLRIAEPAPEEGGAAPEPAPPAQHAGDAFSSVPVADVLLDAMLQHPHDAASAAVRAIHSHVAPRMGLSFRRAGGEPPAPGPGQVVLSQVVRSHGEDAGTLLLTLGADEDQSAARHVLSQVAHLVGKLVSLQDRHNGLQKLAITDELTGLYNARYFRHFLSRIVEKARVMHFPVTLLLFDIDDFKKYNDQFGHGVGDEILRQVAALMKRCTRDHDLVARIGGDEFAVVFWDKEGPRQPKDPHSGSLPGRPPQAPREIFKRFQRLIASEDFPMLGLSGKGVLGVSAGLAVFPYEANDVEGLLTEADRRLVHGAKKSGKNTLFIVGTDDPTLPPGEAKL
jgi:two-component system, cell cycle response regulator